jgi:hypothetical protein
VLDFTRRGADIDLFVRVFEGDSTIVRALEFENAHVTRRSVMEKAWATWWAFRTIARVSRSRGSACSTSASSPSSVSRASSRWAKAARR